MVRAWWPVIAALALALHAQSAESATASVSYDFAELEVSKAPATLTKAPTAASYKPSDYVGDDDGKDDNDAGKKETTVTQAPATNTPSPTATFATLTRAPSSSPPSAAAAATPTPETDKVKDSTSKPTPKVTEKPKTEKPTETPTEKPKTEKPTEEPTKEPTEQPIEKPTTAPTEKPTVKPTAAPTEKPTDEPTEKPTEKPTTAPTEEPTDDDEPEEEDPTEKPTTKPTAAPTPSATPTLTPKATAALSPAPTSPSHDCSTDTSGLVTKFFENNNALAGECAAANGNYKFPFDGAPTREQMINMGKTTACTVLMQALLQIVASECDFKKVALRSTAEAVLQLNKDLKKSSSSAALPSGDAIAQAIAQRRKELLNIPSGQSNGAETKTPASTSDAKSSGAAASTSSWGISKSTAADGEDDDGEHVLLDDKLLVVGTWSDVDESESAGPPVITARPKDTTPVSAESTMSGASSLWTASSWTTAVATMALSLLALAN